MHRAKIFGGRGVEYLVYGISDYVSTTDEDVSFVSGSEHNPGKH